MRNDMVDISINKQRLAKLRMFIDELDALENMFFKLTVNKVRAQIRELEVTEEFDEVEAKDTSNVTKP